VILRISLVEASLGCMIQSEGKK